jgi:hypothetical protein
MSELLTSEQRLPVEREKLVHSLKISWERLQMHEVGWAGIGAWGLRESASS